MSIIKQLNKLFFVIVCIIALVACKKSDWFDIKSNKRLAVPTTLKDMQALLDNGSTMNNFTPGLGEVATDDHFISDAQFDRLAGPEKNAYTWLLEQPNRIVRDWTNGNSNGSYIRVFYANLVLDGLKKIKASNADEKDQWSNIQGQALFHRAHAFYELAQIFAPPFREVAGKPGIPLRLEADINIPTTRSTLQQTYDQLINDLLVASTLMPENPAYRSRPSKQACYALLARTYLNMGYYALAGQYADSSLRSNSTLMEYKDLDYGSLENPFIDYNPEVIFYSRMVPYRSLNFAVMRINPDLVGLYHENDLRSKCFFNKDLVSGITTYKGAYSGRSFTECFSGLSTNEIYLIRAECFARENKVAEAMDDLNTLLRTRWDGAYTDMTAANSEEALEKILLERRKELVLRGLRWTDLRRLNDDPALATAQQRSNAGRTFTIEPGSRKYTLLLPEDIIEISGIAQNEGW